MDVTQFTRTQRRFAAYFAKQPPSTRIYPLINLSACPRCEGKGRRTVNGVDYWCMNCGGSGTKVS